MDADKLYVDSLQALWEIDFGEESHSTLPLLNFEPAGRARTLLCHDMKGGYLEQEREQGIALPSESIYLFMHWWNIDIFNYFSHHMVTIPPIGWTNAAHKHDTQILGTFITEFDQGVEHCKKLLEDKQSVDRTVSKLVEAAKTFGFDGWLVNIENKVEQQHLDNLKYFLVELRRKMHEAIGQRAMVVWYDSVTVNGELKWQDALNEENRDWFDCVDAIYLNYCWDEEKLAKSREVAGDRLHDVFAGVDCFGRGCYGGGQWNCRLALKAIQNEDLSCALFAPGWIAECFPKRCIVQQSLKFWNPLSGYVPCRSISAREFSTRFRTGMSSERFCLADIDIQPVFITELGQVNPFEPHEEGLEIQPGTHKLFRFKNFPVNARISFTTSDGAVSLKLPEGFEMEEVSEGEYLVHASSHCCDVRISTKQRCVLTSFSFVPL
uniref:Mannosyl-glycoprotein endo-beta-N-acetylglucosaminidase n=1 Tax=Steinernema glaseri TaxID=37863 RepID=A0A1I7ZTW0_9BILA